MKIKPVENKSSSVVEVRYNPNTKGTHLFVLDGKDNPEKKDYANIVLISLMGKRGFLKNSLEETIDSSNHFVDEYENRNVKGL